MANKKSDKDWIKLNRSLADHWIWTDEVFTKGQAWADLIMRARWKDEKKKHRGKVVLRKRGEVCCSLSFLAERWGWSRNKVRRFMDILEAENMVTVNATRYDTVITIENYSKFQDSNLVGEARDETTDEARDEATDETTDEAQKKKVKKVKKEKNTPPYKSPQGDAELEAEVNQLPLEIRSIVFEFIEHRKEIRHPFTVRGLRMMLKKLNELSGGDTQTSIKILEQSIANGWQGIFALKNQQNNKKPRNEVLEMLKAGVFDEEE